jgi:chromosome segregation ATPase
MREDAEREERRDGALRQSISALEAIVAKNEASLLAALQAMNKLVRGFESTFSRLENKITEAETRQAQLEGRLAMCEMREAMAERKSIDLPPLRAVK